MVVVGSLFATYRSFSYGLRNYAGVTLGVTRGEVRYRLGSPPVVFGKASDDPTGPWGKYQPVYFVDPKRDPINQLPKGTTDEDYDEWSYEPSDVSSINVKFDTKSNRVISVGCFDFSLTHSDCPPLLGVISGASEEALLKRLGKPTREVLDQEAKTVHYDDLGAAFVLKRSRVYGFGLEKQDVRSGAIMSRILMGLF